MLVTYAHPYCRVAGVRLSFDGGGRGGCLRV